MEEEVTDAERKAYITHMALAIMNEARLCGPTAKKIYGFADAILNLAEKSDGFIVANKEQFDEILQDAKEINNRRA